MHNHNGEKSGSWMMWAMMLCCILPLAILGFLFFKSPDSGSPPWGTIGIVGIVVVIHLIIMMKGHTRHRNSVKPKDSRHFDPVCGMEASGESFKAEYQNKSYYFCSNHCKEQFIANPSNYAD